MNKQEMVASVAEKSGLSKKDSEKAVNAFVEAIKEALANGQKVTIVGFGTFEVRQRQARTGRNPQTGEPMYIPAQKVPAFRPGKELKESV